MEDKLYSPAVIAGIQKRHGFRVSKSLGQNFLADRNITERIIEGSGIGSDDLVVEVGPGMGVLTAQAALKAKRVIAIEIDSHLIPILQETLAGLSNIKVLRADILKTDLKKIIEDEEMSYSDVKLIGNLPYYITTAIIMKVLQQRVNISSMTVMLQKEVADRINASPCTKDYGSLSVAAQYYAKTSHVLNVPRDVFTPRPNVDSCVIRLDVLQKPPVSLADEELFFKVVRAGFGQRRKTLQNSLQSKFSKELVTSSLQESGIDPIRRAETLSVQEFANLSNAMAHIQPRT